MFRCFGLSAVMLIVSQTTAHMFMSSWICIPLNRKTTFLGPTAAARPAFSAPGAFAVSLLSGLSVVGMWNSGAEALSPGRRLGSLLLLSGRALSSSSPSLFGEHGGLADLSRSRHVVEASALLGEGAAENVEDEVEEEDLVGLARAAWPPPMLRRLVAWWPACGVAPAAPRGGPRAARLSSARWKWLRPLLAERCQCRVLVQLH